MSSTSPGPNSTSKRPSQRFFVVDTLQGKMLEAQRSLDSCSGDLQGDFKAYESLSAATGVRLFYMRRDEDCCAQNAASGRGITEIAQTSYLIKEDAECREQDKKNIPAAVHGPSLICPDWHKQRDISFSGCRANFLHATIDRIPQHHFESEDLLYATMMNNKTVFYVFMRYAKLMQCIPATTIVLTSQLKRFLLSNVQRGWCGSVMRLRGSAQCSVDQTNSVIVKAAGSCGQSNFMLQADFNVASRLKSIQRIIEEIDYDSDSFRNQSVVVQNILPPAPGNESYTMTRYLIYAVGGDIKWLHPVFADKTKEWDSHGEEKEREWSPQRLRGKDFFNEMDLLTQAMDAFDPYAFFQWCMTASLAPLEKPAVHLVMLEMMIELEKDIFFDFKLDNFLDSVKRAPHAKEQQTQLAHFIRTHRRRIAQVSLPFIGIKPIAEFRERHGFMSKKDYEARESARQRMRSQCLHAVKQFLFVGLCLSLGYCFLYRLLLSPDST